MRRNERAQRLERCGTRPLIADARAIGVEVNRGRWGLQRRDNLLDREGRPGVEEPHRRILPREDLPEPRFGRAAEAAAEADEIEILRIEARRRRIGLHGALHREAICCQLLHHAIENIGRTAEDQDAGGPQRRILIWHGAYS